MWSALLYNKGGDALLCLYIVVSLPWLICRCTYFLWLKLVVEMARALHRHAIRDFRLGYGLKLALKINLYVAKQLEEEEPMKGIRFDKPHDFVCKCDEGKPKKEQTVFHVRFLTAKEQADLRDRVYNVSGFGEKRSEKFLSGTIALEALRIGLKGWENFNFDDGEPIPFTEDNFSCIPPRERDEIANYIRGIPEEEVA